MRTTLFVLFVVASIGLQACQSQTTTSFGTERSTRPTVQQASLATFLAVESGWDGTCTFIEDGSTKSCQIIFSDSGARYWGDVNAEVRYGSSRRLRHAKLVAGGIELYKVGSDGKRTSVVREVLHLDQAADGEIILRGSFETTGTVPGDIRLRRNDDIL